MIDYFCPKSKKPLKVINNYLCDLNGQKKFPIVNGIPRFLNNPLNYAEMWGYQWGKFQTMQFDSVLKTADARERLEFCYGKDLANLKNLNVLEVGSGAGRFTEVLCQTGAFLHTLDATKAIEYNKTNNSFKSNTICFSQQNLFDIHYPKNIFDCVICLGVIQHTHNSTIAIQKLFEHVKPGGVLILDHYQFVISYFFGTTEVFRFFIKKFKYKNSLYICKKLVNFFFPIFWFFRKKKIILKLLQKVIPLGIGNSLRKNSYDFETAKNITILDTNDALSDPIKNLLTKNQLYNILKTLPNSKIELLSEKRPGSNGLEARIKKI